MDKEGALMENDTRILLITGAAGGIGRATVNVFSEHGWKVIGVDRSPKYAGFPENGIYIQADI
jgi:glucose 1-dehydrogenase